MQDALKLHIKRVAYQADFFRRTHNDKNSRATMTNPVVLDSDVKPYGVKPGQMVQSYRHSCWEAAMTWRRL